VGLPAVGLAARLGGTQLTKNAARSASELVATGGQSAEVPPLTPERVDALRALLVGTSQQGHKLKNASVDD
jgi:hypothetical protein